MRPPNSFMLWRGYEMRQLARGRWQAFLLRELMAGRTVPASASRMLQGRAKEYSGRYQSSMGALLTRVKAAGFTVSYEASGPRGGLVVRVDR